MVMDFELERDGVWVTGVKFAKGAFSKISIFNCLHNDFTPVTPVSPVTKTFWRWRGADRGLPGMEPEQPNPPKETAVCGPGVTFRYITYTS